MTDPGLPVLPERRSKEDANKGKKTVQNYNSRQQVAKPVSPPLMINNSSEERGGKQSKPHGSHAHSNSYNGDETYDSGLTVARIQEILAQKSKSAQASEPSRGITDYNPNLPVVRSRNTQDDFSFSFSFDKSGSRGKSKVVNGGFDKRGFGFGADNLKKLQPPDLHRHNSILSPADRNRPFNVSNAGYEPARSQYPRALHAQAEIGYERRRMPGRSPGRQRKKSSQKIKGLQPTQETTGDPGSSPIIDEGEPEIADSQDQDELQCDNEVEVVLKSTRIKRNTGTEQHQTEMNAKSIVTVEIPYTHNIQDDTREIKDAPKKQRWAALERYNSSADSTPNYGPPTDFEAPPAKRVKTSTMLRGPKPVNTLRNDANSARDLNPPFVQPLKLATNGFSLSDGDASGRTGPPAKKRKMDETSTSSRAQQTHKAVINLDSQSSQKKDATSAKSSQSQLQNGQRRSVGAFESISVEDKMRSNKNRRKPKTAGRQQYPRSEDSDSIIFKHDNVMNGYDIDDPEDPIDVDSPPASQKTSSAAAPIPVRYKGNAFRQPAREFHAKGRQSLSTVRRNNQTTSPYFPIGQQRRGASLSEVDREVVVIGTGRTTRQQNGASNQKNGASELSASRKVGDASEDELAMDMSTNMRMANSLLKTKQQNGSTNTKKRDLSSEDSDYSETQYQNTNMDTKLSKRQKPKLPRESRFRVIQVFSQRQNWLSQGLDNPWSLNQDVENGILSFFNGKGKSVPELSLESKFFTSISRSQDSGKLVIYRPMDNQLKGGHQIYLELDNKDEVADFVSNVRLIIPSVGLKPVTVDKLDKIFENTQSEMQKPRPTKNEEPDDIRQAKRKQEAGVGASMDKALAAKQPSLKMSEQMENDRPVPARRTRRLVSGTHVRNLLDAYVVESDDFYRPSNAATADHNNIHLTRSRNASEQVGPQQQRKLRSPSPERWTETNPDWVRQYNWQDSIIYPKDGKHKATVDKQDIQRLDEGEFLNDNLIMFYLLRLERELAERDSAISKRVYFHNTFFYTKLAKPVAGKRGINYGAVERWTSKVKLLSYDYIIVPVNENSHWYLAIIYNAPKLIQPKPDVIELSQPEEMKSEAKSLQSNTDIASKSTPVSSPHQPVFVPGVDEKLRKMSIEEPKDGSSKFDSTHPVPAQTTPKSVPQTIEERTAKEKASIDTTKAPNPASPAKRGRKKSSTPAIRKFSMKDPKIITLDSLGMSHSGTCTNLRDYLVAEGKAKLDIDIDPPRALGMTGVNIPQQKNYCDCGLYLLSYVEAFLKNPDGFTADLLAKADMDLEHSFEKASDIRNHIRKLLLELQKEQVAEKAKKDLAKQKSGKGKKAAKAQEAVSTPTESDSREASRSARPSAETDRQKSSRLSAQPEHAVEEATPEPPKQTARDERRSKKPTERRLMMEGHGHDTGYAEAETGPPKPSSREIITVDEEADHIPQFLTSDKRPSVLETGLSILKTAAGIGRSSRSSEVEAPGTSRDTPVEVDDESQQMDHHAAQHLSDGTSPPAQPQSHLSSPSPDTEVALPRRRASTPYPKANAHLGFDGVEEDEYPHTPAEEDDDTPPESSPLLSAAKPPLRETALNAVDLTSDESQTPNDNEMLLPQAPPLLDSPSPFTSTSNATEKWNSVTAPQRASSRKSDVPQLSRVLPSHSAGQSQPSSVEQRDSSDGPLLRHWKMGSEWKGQHKRFDS